MSAQSRAFFDYVRGRSDTVPAGYSANGMRAYRHLVFIGASQSIDAHHPGLRDQLGEDAWRVLIQDFIQHSAWESPIYGDLPHAFAQYLDQQRADQAA